MGIINCELCNRPDGCDQWDKCSAKGLCHYTGSSLYEQSAEESGVKVYISNLKAFKDSLAAAKDKHLEEDHVINLINSMGPTPFIPTHCFNITGCNQLAYCETANRCLGLSPPFNPGKRTTDHTDPIHPPHYQGDYVMRIIEDFHLDFLDGQVIKYILRSGNKPGEPRVRDLEKALWYLQRKIANEKEGDDRRPPPLRSGD